MKRLTSGVCIVTAACGALAADASGIARTASRSIEITPNASAATGVPDAQENERFLDATKREFESQVTRQRAMRGTGEFGGEKNVIITVPQLQDVVPFNNRAATNNINVVIDKHDVKTHSVNVIVDVGNTDLRFLPPAKRQVETDVFTIRRSGSTFWDPPLSQQTPRASVGSVLIDHTYPINVDLRVEQLPSTFPPDRRIR